MKPAFLPFLRPCPLAIEIYKSSQTWRHCEADTTFFPSSSLLNSSPQSSQLPLPPWPLLLCASSWRIAIFFVALPLLLYNFHCCFVHAADAQQFSLLLYHIHCCFVHAADAKPPCWLITKAYNAQMAGADVVSVNLVSAKIIHRVST